MDDEYTYFVSNPSFFDTSGSVSFGVADNIPIATLSYGGAIQFTCDSSSCTINLYKYQRTGNVLIYINGDFFAKVTLGISANYTKVPYTINNLDDASDILLVAEGNYLIPYGQTREAQSNVIVGSVVGSGHYKNVDELQNFSFIFITVLLFVIAVSSVFRLFGFFGSR